MEPCIHGMSQESCGFCNPRKSKKPKHPKHREDKTLHGALAVDAEEVQKQGYLVVRTGKGRDDPSFGNLDKTITLVHVHGHPFLWAVDEILKRAPNLRVLRVIPTFEGRMSSRHRELCKTRNVQLITGYHMPQMAWGEGEIRSRLYHTQQTFLLNLQGEQKMLFEELLAFGFEAASMASRYFCLQGEEYLPQVRLASEYGYPEGLHHYVSAKINAVLYYLDSSFESSSKAKALAATIRNRLPVLRARFCSDVQRKELAEEFRTKYDLPLASNFPLVRLGLYEELSKAQKDGRLNALCTKEPKDWEVLVLRFGLDKPDVGTYRTLAEVGTLTGVSRERIRQRELQAFVSLGIVSSHEAREGKPFEDDL